MYGVKTQNLAIPLTRRIRINSAFVPLHIAKIYILKLCLEEEIIPRCRFPCSRGTEHLEEILKDLEKYGTIEVDRNMAIVCIVGDFSAGKSGLGAQVLKALEEVPLRMISYGGSAHNISVLVKEEDKKKAMTDLSHKLEDLQH